MRKSAYVTLLLGGAAVLGVWALSNDKTSMDQEPKLYGDAAACAQDAGADAAACAEGFEVAKKEHEAQAPKFATAEECQAAGYTQCQTTQVMNTNGSSTGMFMPMMMGFMMGRMMGGGMGGMGGYGLGPRPTPGAGGATTNTASAGTARPVYADRNGYLYANGGTVGRVAPGTTSLGSQAVPMRTASRGGFGASASRFGGGAGA